MSHDFDSNTHISAIALAPSSPQSHRDSDSRDPFIADFASLWHSLPTELQLEILSHNLTSPTGIARYRVYHDDANIAQGYFWRVTLIESLRDHLAMGDHIASLSRTVYYEQNLFVVRATTYGCRIGFPFPPRAMRPLIRRLRIEVHLCYRSWCMVQRLAAGEVGFVNLRFIDVHFLWPPWHEPAFNWLAPREWHRREKVVFRCAGRVSFEEEEKIRKKEWLTGFLGRKGTNREGLSAWITGLVTFGADKDIGGISDDGE